MTDDPLIGRQLANFRLERVLGRGGMAQVYYGLDVKLQRPVAVKVIDARFRDNPAYARRFVREAQAVATWRHENIAQIYYADEEGGLTGPPRRQTAGRKTSPPHPARRLSNRREGLAQTEPTPLPTDPY